MKTTMIAFSAIMSMRHGSADFSDGFAWALIISLLILAVVIGIVYYFEEKK